MSLFADEVDRGLPVRFFYCCWPPQTPRETSHLHGYHCINSLFPSNKSSVGLYDLRARTHNYELPAWQSNIFRNSCCLMPVQIQVGRNVQW